MKPAAGVTAPRAKSVDIPIGSLVNTVRERRPGEVATSRFLNQSGCAQIESSRVTDGNAWFPPRVRLTAQVVTIINYFFVHTNGNISVTYCAAGSSSRKRDMAIIPWRESGVFVNSFLTSLGTFSILK